MISLIESYQDGWCGRSGANTTENVSLATMVVPCEWAWTNRSFNDQHWCREELKHGLFTGSCSCTMYFFFGIGELPQVPIQLPGVVNVSRSPSLVEAAKVRT